MAHPLLFTPLSMRGVTLPNRIVVAPMHQYSAVRGFANDWHLMNAGRYAAGGAGFVMMESTKVERRGCGTLGDLGLWDDAFIPGLARIVDFIKGCGSVAGIQLGHSGRKARTGRPWEGGRPLERSADVDDWDAWELVAPSAIAADERSPVPRALERAEIAAVAQAFGKAAARAHTAGFDVVEIHGAHGFLIHEFLSPAANQRTDDYGGSERNRMRFAIEVVEAVRAHWPQDKPLFLRLSAEDDAGWGPEQSIALAKEVKPLGVDVIDCSSGGILGKAPSVAPAYDYQVPYAERIRREAGVLTMAVGLIVHAQQAERILQDGRADLIALAREMLYNPNWAMDAAQKLGVDPKFEMLPPPYQYWLSRRAATVPGVVPSTYGPGDLPD
ncbi:NADH:flavin oxidoreductase/NADH oxidase [Quisquiliibacterium transsilvanicum]|uniref:2,4-dienoyl-CoA reductase-like NADH-dependent reductase (Old Yellow Enzyme family) n=1 Tax=Quisquiliibacterium transsilvanicum TaxID=1549638 RepID=A0A7W8M8B7_9BURK|nr:NADH:flavin oxidoreductase/NADH oxidase [Quisquiliibacterium transsilvanicum]MBB5271105.1 2,4-dienoyl-CoA reductase-like NADH-dependent reductase (Old Yellow Enzyme family) [Quisquiliibacterium transsilvanicum]